MAHLRYACSFDDVKKSNQICGNIILWRFQRIAYPGLCGQMRNMQGLVRGEEMRHRALVCKIAFVEDEFRMLPQLCEAIFFQLHIIIAVKTVKADDLAACLQKAACNMKADKACTACHQNGAFFQAFNCFVTRHLAIRLRSPQATQARGPCLC